MKVPWWFRAAARVRGAGAAAGPVLIVGGWLVIVLTGAASLGVALVAAGAVPLFLSLAAALWPGAPRIEPVLVAAPVRGRWVALNSPASKRPSHGTHGYGQTYAVDLVHEPEPGSRPAFAAGPGFRPPTDFPGFGAPVLAPAAGTVVKVCDGARDHRSRLSWPGFFYLLAEGMVREFAGPRFLLGNHVIIDLGGGVHAALAHLRRGHITVRPGQRVEAGQQIARCGNSGNSSEPHLHFQLMDSPHPAIAAGLPFRLPEELPASQEAHVFR